MDAQWNLWARKATKAGCEEGCTKHYEGTWQPRRQGSLKECSEEMMYANLQFDAFWLAWGTWENHERPATVSGSATS